MSNDFTIKQIEMELARLKSSGGVGQAESTNEEGNNFGKVLEDAISEVNELQKDSNESVEKQMLASEGTELHTTMLQIQKAEVSFQTMMQVRNKILKAYEEIVKTPM